MYLYIYVGTGKNKCLKSIIQMHSSKAKQKALKNLYMNKCVFSSSGWTRTQDVIYVFLISKAFIEDIFLFNIYYRYRISNVFNEEKPACFSFLS